MFESYQAPDDDRNTDTEKRALYGRTTLNESLLPLRLEGEPKQAYEVFRSYCLLGTNRTLDLLQAHLPKYTKNTLKIYSSRHQWTERSREYDQLIAKEAERQQINDIIEYRNTLRENARLMTDAARLLLKRVVREIDEIPMSSGTLTAISNLVKVANELDDKALQVSELVAKLHENDTQQDT